MQSTAMLQPQHQQRLHPAHKQQRSSCCPATTTKSKRTHVSASTPTAAAQPQHHQQQQVRQAGVATHQSTSWRGQALQHAARVPVAAPTPTPRTAAVLKAASAPAAAPAAETADASKNASALTAAQQQSLDVLEWRSVCRQVRTRPPQLHMQQQTP